MKLGLDMTTNVTVLRPKDVLHLDSAPIEAMYRAMGPDQAEHVITRALEELALAMSGMAAQVRGKDLQDLSRRLRRLQRMAEQLGMVSLCRVAGDLRHCLDLGDATAFAAVWARLMRIAERSLLPGGPLPGLVG